MKMIRFRSCSVTSKTNTISFSCRTMMRFAWFHYVA